MDKFNLRLLILGSFLLLSSAPKPQLYQVISAHPHDLKDIAPYIKTVKQSGRLWLVEIHPQTPKRLMSNFRATDGSDVKHYMPRLSKTSDFSVAIADFTNRIDSANIKADIEALASFKTRLVGTPENQKATAALGTIFKNMGYTVSQPCYRAGACSIVADKPGKSRNGGVIMIMAHFDSVGKDFAGADDNGSGTAVLIEVARVLRDYNNKNTIRFFATNGEESGLYGAEHYAKVLTESGEIKRVLMAINMDMVGYNSNGIVELETDSQYEGMAKSFAQLAANYTKLKSKITIGAWGSDHVPFIKSGVPTLLTIEDWSTKTPCYHTACDKPNTINNEYAAEIAKLNLAAIMARDAN